MNDISLTTHSSMASFLTCRRQHYYRYGLGVRPISATKALSFGALMHRGWELSARGELGDGARLVEDSNVLFAAIAMRLLTLHDWYWSPRDGLAPNLQVAEYLATERTYNMVLGGYVFAGKIDGIVRLADGRVAVFEHKTTGDPIEPGSDYWTRLRIDAQISLYMLGARSMGYEAETVLYNVVRKPKSDPYRATPEALRKYTKPTKNEPARLYSNQRAYDETIEEYIERIGQEIVAAPHEYFGRMEIPRLNDDLASFENDVIAAAGDIQRAYAENRLYRNTSACIYRGRCEYLDHCGAGLDPANPPSGFTVVRNVHQELETTR